MVEFVRSEHEGGTHSAVARLHSGVDSYNGIIAETFAVMDTRNVVIHQLRSGKKAKQFRLSPDEMKALVTAYAQFEADTQAAIEAEEVRKAGAHDEALRLASELGLEVTDLGTDSDGDTRFNIKHPHRSIPRSYAYSIDGLLECVKQFQEQVEEERKTLLEAREIANKITALCGDTISIKSEKHNTNNCDLSITGRFSAYSLCNVQASDVLMRLQPILNQLEQEAKAQQTSAIS